MNESRTPRTDALLANPGNDPEEVGWIEHARQLELELAAVSNERDALRAEIAYVTLQRNALLEMTWLDLPGEPDESTKKWGAEFEKGWTRK